MDGSRRPPTRDWPEALPRSQADTYQGGAPLRSRPPFQRRTLEQAIMTTAPDPTTAAPDARLTCCAKALRSPSQGIKIEREDGPGKLDQNALLEKTRRARCWIRPLYAIRGGWHRCRTQRADPFIADRFEFFSRARDRQRLLRRLTDPEEQAARFRAQGRPQGPRRRGSDVLDADYVRGSSTDAAAAGLGVGIDRWYVFTDSPSIRDVILFRKCGRNG